MLSKTHTKYIQSLQHKKLRDETGLFIAEGPKVVMDLLNSRKFICKEIFALNNWLQEHSKHLSLLKDTAVTEAEDFELQKISSLSTAHAVLAVFEKRKPDYKIETAFKITLVLDTIQDPGNLGTIIRIADWFGIENIVCSTGCADMYNAKVVQSTMGSLGRVNVIYTDIVAWLKENNKIKIYSASLEGEDVKVVGKLKEGILIIGNEANGVSDEVMDLVNEKINIPRIGEAESLNAAVATGIILSHVR
ncbi:MAG: RNA methyltransferase [Chitinophagaceae bacterium]|nr:RNA methyltransferase [Chitinophagaceae bacterium]MBL0201767.1 RNA methyltransferase [Chitinophagaceae bacterium]